MLLLERKVPLGQANLNCHLAIERREKEYLLGTTSSENKVRQR